MTLTRITSDGITDGTITGTDLTTNVDLVDNQKLRLGTSNEFEIFHDGTNSIIKESTISGSLKILGQSILFKNTNDNEVFIDCHLNGNVELFYDNSKKFETASNGAIVTGSLGVDELYMGDNEQIKIGAEDDFLIYHGGSENVLDGVLHKIELRHGSEKHLVANPDGAVELYHDNVKKLQTDSAGTVFYDDTFLGDNLKANFGASADLQIYHDGNNSFIENAGVGSLNLYGDEVNILNKARSEFKAKFITDGAVELYHDNSKKFETTSAGADISGDLVIDGAAGGTLTLGGSSAHTSKLVIADNGGTGNGNFLVEGGDGTDFFTVNSAGSIIPSGTTRDLGSSSNRWRNIYTNDLNLSNEGSSNDVDGTWGSFTIQEGAEDLFLVNKRSGKKYKFNLTEVA